MLTHLNGRLQRRHTAAQGICDRIGTNRHRLQHGKFWFARRNTFVTMNVLDTGTGTQGGCEISFPGDVQDLTGLSLAS